MAVEVDCSRVGCGESVESSDVLVLPGRMPDEIRVSLPEGWGADRVGNDYVVHCPSHRTPAGYSVVRYDSELVKDEYPSRGAVVIAHKAQQAEQSLTEPLNSGAEQWMRYKEREEGYR